MPALLAYVIKPGWPHISLLTRVTCCLTSLFSRYLLFFYLFPLYFPSPFLPPFVRDFFFLPATRATKRSLFRCFYILGQLGLTHRRATVVDFSSSFLWRCRRQGAVMIVGKIAISIVAKLRLCGRYRWSLLRVCLEFWWGVIFLNKEKSKLRVA